VSRGVYFASPEGLTGKSAVALGLLDALNREVGSVGVFRPLPTARSSSEDIDLIVDLLVNQPSIFQSYDEAIAMIYEVAREDLNEVLHAVVERFGQLTDRFEVILVIGSDYTDAASGTELSLNAKIAANLGFTSPLDADLVEQFAAAFAEARARNGMTVERAREIVTDIFYFGTLMVHLGLADGMVSGAVNTTTHTIRPALEFIKTKPGVNTISSVFLMCLPDRVLVYNDCAVIPEPTTEQLADLAISSTGTALQLSVEPWAAMLSSSPANDLSRGALASDIVNTVAITAVQAQAIKETQPVQTAAAGTRV
jgi:phosphotransacetylase